MMGMVMAGGRGTRMGPGAEKLLLPPGDPAVMRVVGALRGCCGRVVAVTSPNSPLTRKLLRERGVETIDSGGAGYAADLYGALQQADGPVLAVPGDMPLLDGAMARKIASMYDGGAWTAIVSTLKFLKSQGIEPGPAAGGGLYYTGVSLVNPTLVTSPGPVDERHMIVDDRRVAFNLNTRSDYNSLCAL